MPLHLFLRSNGMETPVSGPLRLMWAQSLGQPTRDGNTERTTVVNGGKTVLTLLPHPGGFGWLVSAPQDGFLPLSPLSLTFLIYKMGIIISILQSFSDKFKIFILSGQHVVCN